MDFGRLFKTILIVVAIFLVVNMLTSMFSNKKQANNQATTAAGHIDYSLTEKQPFSRENDASPTTIVLGNAQASSKDKLSITVNNVMAGIDQVELNAKNYAEHVIDRSHPVAEPLVLFKAQEGLIKPYSTLGIRIILPGKTDPIDLTGDFRHYVWSVEKDPANPYQVKLHATLKSGEAMSLEVTKIFKIDPASYDLTISHEVKNLSGAAVKVAIDQLTSTDLPVDPSQGDDRFYHAAGLDSTKKIIVSDRFNMLHTGLDAETKEIGKFGGNDPLEWVASSGHFFTAITRPTQTTGPVFKLADEKVIPMVDHVASANIDILRRDLDVTKSVGGIRLAGEFVEVKPKETVSMPLAVFFGPKSGEALLGDVHAVGTEAWAHRVYDYNTIIQFNTGGCYKYCTFDILGEVLLKMLNFLRNYVTFGNYGFAIILLVIITRALMHPLTRASQVNMATMGKKMKDIQPLIEANKKKYAKDKTKQTEEMMKIYKEHKVNPAGGVLGCLPMLIQMPIWIAMWSVLRTDIDLRHAAFIPGWINDLSVPDMTMTFTPFHIPLVGWEVSALNILPLLLGIVFFLQMKVQAASQPKPADEQQATMQKMTMYMTLLFPLFLYKMPSGLNLYYFASTLSGLVDTYFVRKTLKRKGILPANAKALPTHEEKD